MQSQTSSPAFVPLTKSSNKMASAWDKSFVLLFTFRLSSAHSKCKLSCCDSSQLCCEERCFNLSFAALIPVLLMSRVKNAFWDLTAHSPAKGFQGKTALAAEVRRLLLESFFVRLPLTHFLRKLKLDPTEIEASGYAAARRRQLSPVTTGDVERQRGEDSSEFGCFIE